MERRDHVRFLRPVAEVLPVLVCLLTAIGMYPLATSTAFMPALFPGVAFCEGAPAAAIEGVWQLALPMPGGTKESILSLTARGDALSGTMSSPGDPADVHPIYGGVCRGPGFSLSADIGRITYVIEGTLAGDMLSFDLETKETIPLGDGRRLGGTPGEISGKYLVPVYSPGGVMENHFELVAENGRITGQMYVPTSGSETLPDKTMGAPPGGPPAGAPPASAAPGAGGGKRDINTFYDGTYVGSRIALFTRTAQGSRFNFSGTIEEDTIRLTLSVTDERQGLEALRVE